jgi:hypothetical protein
VVNNLVPGTDYVFTADAKNTATPPVSIFHGVAQPVTITNNATAQVTIFLNQVNAPGLTNSAPVIDTVTYSANQVAQGGTVALTATAHDPDAGQTAHLTFVWTTAAGCGSVTPAVVVAGNDTTDSSATATYTAPNANIDCQITLTVTDPLGTSNQSAFSIRVGLGSTGAGNAKVSAVVNGAPIIGSVTSTPAVIVLGASNSPGLSVSAVDPEGNPLSYAWTSNTAGCTVNFGAATSATTSFSVSAATGTTSCKFSVTVSDSGWSTSTPPVVNSVIASLTLPVAGSTSTTFGPPLFGLTYQSEDTISGSDAVVLAAVATDPAGGTISYTYAWAVDTTTGTSFVTASDASLSLDAIFTTAGTWTVPAGAESASAASFTVTATSSVSHLPASYVFHFAPANNPCASLGEGATCTSSNLCATAATCQSGACVATTLKPACPNLGNLCMIDQCMPTTGLCGQVPVGAGTACNDHNGCTGPDLCDGSGVCNTPAVAGPALTQCQASEVCVSTGDNTQTFTVTNKASGTGCDADGSPCTANDACNSSGVCIAGANACATDPNGPVCHVTSPTAFTCTQPPMQPAYSEMFLPPFQANALGADGTPWIVGNIFNPFDFSTNTNACTMGTGQCVTSTGSADVFLAKLNPATGLATVTKTFGQIATPNSSDQTAAGVAVASNGFVAVVGQFSSEIDFDGNDSLGTNGTAGIQGVDWQGTLAASANYIATFDGNGAPIKNYAAGVGTGALLAVASNPTQAAFAVCGKTSVKVSGAGLLTPTTQTAGGGMDIYVAKVDAATGTVLWGKQFGGAGDQVCQSVALDNNGDVIIAGGYTGTLQFGTLTAFTTISDTTASLLYVAKLASADGTPLAAATWGTTGKVTPFGLTVDASSNIIVGGSLGATITMGTFTLTDLGLTDAFVAKLNTSLAPQWAKSFGDATFDQQVKGLAASSTGDVYVAGLFIGSLGTEMGLHSAANTNSDGFVAHLSGLDGSVVGANSYGDASGGQSVLSIAVARAATGTLANEVAIGGGFSSTITFGTNVLNTGSPSIAQSYYARLAP